MFDFPPNNSIQRMGTSRLAQSQFVARGRLAPTADAERWTNDMIAHPRTKALVLLAALSLAAGCANPVFEEPRQSVGQTVALGPQAEPQAVRLSVGDTVVVSLDGTSWPVPPLTNHVAGDGTITIYSLRFKAADLTPDELASQIHTTLVTNWVRVGKVNVLKVQLHGPANGSQPFPSETNQASSAAGFRR